MKTIDLLQSNSVPFLTEGDRHCRPGWVQTRCPFCESGPTKWHMGWNLETGRTTCWSCGSHRTKDTIAAILGIPLTKAAELMRVYRFGWLHGPAEKEVIRPTQVDLPGGSAPISNQHEKYLISRGFDPDHIREDWGILGTGLIGRYSHRIVIPIQFNGRLISWQTRDITGLAKNKYMSCPDDQEAYPHKQMVYGIDHALSDEVIIVEGVFDAWRLGYGAVATFGIKYTPAQVRLLSEYKHALILFDGEDQAQKQADKLAADLSILGVQVVIGEIEGDPAELDQKEADHITRNWRELCHV